MNPPLSRREFLLANYKGESLTLFTPSSHRNAVTEVQRKEKIRLKEKQKLAISSVKLH